DGFQLFKASLEVVLHLCLSQGFDSQFFIERPDGRYFLRLVEILFRKPILQILRIFSLSQFQGFDQEESLLVGDDITADLFSEFCLIGKDVQKIVIQLKADANIDAEVIESLTVFFFSASQDRSQLKRISQQHRSLQLDHIEIFGLVDGCVPFKVHVKLLPFTDFYGGFVEQTDDLRQQAG